MSNNNFAYGLARLIHARSDTDSIDPTFVPSLVSQIMTQQYFNVGFLVLLVYHSIITMDKEVVYFWLGKVKTPQLTQLDLLCKSLYRTTLGRLFCSFEQFQEHSNELYSFQLTRTPGRFTVWTAGLTNLITIILVDYILLLRVLALYNRNGKLTIFLGSLLCLEAVVGISLLIYGILLEGIVVAELEGGMTYCATIGDPPSLLGIIPWTIPLAYGLMLLSFALFKTAEYWKLSSGSKVYHLIEILIRDQMLYYGFVVLCSVFQIITYRILSVDPSVALVLNAAGNPTFLCILGGQLLINLSAAAERGANGGMNFRSFGSMNMDSPERVWGWMTELEYDGRPQTWSCCL